MIYYLGIYSLALIAISFLYSKNKSSDAYLVADRSIGTSSLLFSKFAGAVGVSTFITYTGFAYVYGIGVMGLLLGGIVGYLFFGLWAAPKINTIGKESGVQNQGELVNYVLKSQNAKRLTNWTTAIIQFFWVLLSLVGGAQVIAMFDIMTYEWAVVVTATVVLIYVLLSGLKAVIITDVIQSIIIIAFLGIIVYGISSQNINDISEAQVEKTPIGKIIGLLIYGCLSVFGMADRYQLSMAGKNSGSVKKGLSAAIIPVILVTALLFYIGLSAKVSSPDLEEGTVFVYAMQHLLPISLMPVLLLMFFAGLMSTADTSIFAVSAHLASEFTENKKVLFARIITLIAMCLATLIAFFWRNIIEVTIIGAAMRIVLAVPMIYVLLQKSNSTRFIASTIGGIIGLVGGIIGFGADPKLVITTLVGTLLGLIFRSKQV